MSLPAAHERKTCPNCGHSNKASAKVCPQCGYRFLSASGATILRKRCEHCGHMNRMGAKRCSQCGTPFQSKTAVLDAQAQKWCPQCGNQRRPNAKVCSYCGYRFKVPAPKPAAEQPITQANTRSTPITIHNTTTSTPTPKPPDLSGEPAPYIPPEELERLRKLGRQDPGLFMRLYHVLQSNTKRDNQT